MAGRPTTDEWIDAGFLAALCSVALAGFSTSFLGSSFLIAGIIGLVGGLVVGYTTARSRQPAVVVAAATAVAFFLLGPVAAARHEALGGVLPSADAVRSLADGVITGWKKLLTTRTPVGSETSLLTIPFVCGLLAAVVGCSLALRTKSSWAPVLAPAAVLIAAILLGTENPYSVALQGGLFSALAIGWIAVRQRAARAAVIRSGTRARFVGAVGLLVVAAGAGVLLHDVVPGAASNDRLILRDRAEPPFDPRDHASPLNSYRRYVKPEEVRTEKTLFTVDGLPEGARIRLATMDAYDGQVWNVSTSGGEASGYFERVGEVIETSRPRPAGRAHVRGRWLPRCVAPQRGRAGHGQLRRPAR